MAKVLIEVVTKLCNVHHLYRDYKCQCQEKAIEHILGVANYTATVAVIITQTVHFTKLLQLASTTKNIPSIDTQNMYMYMYISALPRFNSYKLFFFELLNVQDGQKDV